MRKVITVIVGILLFISIGLTTLGYKLHNDEKNYELFVEAENKRVNNWLKDVEDKKVILFLKTAYCPSCTEILENINLKANARNYIVYAFDEAYLSQENLDIIADKFGIFYDDYGSFIGATKNGTVLGGNSRIFDKEDVTDFFDCWEVDTKDNENDNAKISEWEKEVIKNDTEKIVTVISFPQCQQCNKYIQNIKELSKEKNFKLYYFDAETLSEEDLNKIFHFNNNNLGRGDNGYIYPLPTTIYTFMGNIISFGSGYSNKEQLIERLDNVDKNVKSIKEDNKVEIDEEDERDIQIKKDEDYEYAYYYDKDWKYTNEVLYFKVNGKKVLDDSDNISEILTIKKYKDFIAVETDSHWKGIVSEKHLYIYDYTGNKLYSSENLSLLDLTDLDFGADNEKLNSGDMYYNSYSYDEKSKKLEIKYKFDLYSRIGDVDPSAPPTDRSDTPFCIASKTKTLYDSATISLTLKNKKFEDRTVLDKTVFNIKNYSEKDQDVYYTECGKK